MFCKVLRTWSFTAPSAVCAASFPAAARLGCRYILELVLKCPVLVTVVEFRMNHLCLTQVYLFDSMKESGC